MNKSDTPKLRVMISETFDPWFNLATEDYIFRDMDPDVLTLFLWRNDKTVVIGRFQNPWSECNTSKMEEDGIKLARRQSGGGAVYQDLGNTNFTFMSSKEHFNKEVNNSIIIRALAHFGIEAFASGRNDIMAKTSDGDKKISGSAFKETKDRSFHHGTLLINANMENLALYLKPNPKKLESKGITSVRARVVNLNQLNLDLSHQDLCDRIIHEFFIQYGAQAKLEILDFDQLKSIPKLNEYFLKLSDWNWRFGEAPQFNHQMSEKFDWGLVEVHLDVHKAHVEKTQIFSDSLHPEMIELLMASLTNISYTSEAFQKAISQVRDQLPMIKDYLNEFESWIIKEIR